MTYNSNMQAIEQEATPELYMFRAAGYEWRYTSFRNDLTFIGETYKAASIKRSGFTIGRNPGESKVTITFPLSEPLKNFISAYPIPATAVQVYRALYSDLSQYGLLFDGRFRKATFRDGIINAECSMEDEMSVLMPHVVHQSYCNWQVFDCYCGLNAADYQTEIVLTAVSGSELTSPTFATQATGWWTQGWIQFGGDYRFVTNHVGSVVTLQVPFPSTVVAGTTVQAFPGCDGSPATCVSKFNNFSAHCSMPYIPSHNPVIWGFK